jgi:hypothetical protein
MTTQNVLVERALEEKLPFGICSHWHKRLSKRDEIEV